MEPDADLEAAAAALRRGDLLAACDVAGAALARDPECRALDYVRILALARMGSSKAALDQYRQSALACSPDIDHRALLGRLLKDVAETSPLEARPSAFAAASEAYRAIYDESGDPFPGINAATLAMLSGRRAEAEDMARRLLADPALTRPAGYFAAATRAEALLLVGDLAAAAAALRQALAFPDADDGARSSTLRQFRLLLPCLPDADGSGEALLDLLRPPPVVAYCGHMFRPDTQAEARVAGAIDSALDALGARIAYGSLACGADILVAEAILRRGGELNLVLPFAEEAFVARSVLPGGEPWLHRFERCRDAASSLTCASVSEYVGDSRQFRFGLLLAMGLTRLRARPLGADAVQLAIWDGRASDAEAGTGAEIRHWQESGGRTQVVDPGPIDRRCGQRQQPAENRHRRALRAILFADFAGFSRLSESALPTFSSEILGRAAAVIARQHQDVCARNTWGDGLFVILRSAAAAARLATELQQALRSSDRAMVDAGHGGIRISVHFGPVYEAEDPITGAPTFFGREVTCAARIEPVTPVGGIYATQPMAAMLAMEAPEDFDLSYAGRLALAKDYGTIPIYRLEAAAPHGRPPASPRAGGELRGERLAG